MHQDLPISVRTAPLRLAGLSTELPPRSAPPQARPLVIQDLTRTFMSRVHEVPNRRGSERYSVIENDVFDATDAPRIWTMVAVDSHDNIPDWCERFTVSSGRYATFEHIGLPKDLPRTVARIYQEWAPRIPGLFKTNLEIIEFPANYSPTDPNGRFAYWLPIP